MESAHVQTRLLYFTPTSSFHITNVTVLQYMVRAFNRTDVALPAVQLQKPGQMISEYITNCSLGRGISRSRPHKRSPVAIRIHAMMCHSAGLLPVIRSHETLSLGSSHSLDHLLQMKAHNLPAWSTQSSCCLWAKRGPSNGSMWHVLPTRMCLNSYTPSLPALTASWQVC